jgi:hypothetical protein
VSGSTCVRQKLAYCELSAEGDRVAFLDDDDGHAERDFHREEERRLGAYVAAMGPRVDASLERLARERPDLALVPLRAGLDEVRPWDGDECRAWEAAPEQARSVRFAFAAPDTFEPSFDAPAVAVRLTLARALTPDALARLEQHLLVALTPPGMPTGTFRAAAPAIGFVLPGGEIFPYHSGRRREWTRDDAAVYFRGLDVAAAEPLARALVERLAPVAAAHRGRAGQIVWCELERLVVGRLTVQLGGIDQARRCDAAAAMHVAVESVLGPLPPLGRLSPDADGWSYRVFHEAPAALVAPKVSAWLARGA